MLSLKHHTTRQYGHAYSAYAGPRRVSQVQELRSRLQAMEHQRNCTNALTRARTNNRRRPCRLPASWQPSLPQHEWRPLSPGATPIHLQDMPMFDYNGAHHRVDAPGKYDDHPILHYNGAHHNATAPVVHSEGFGPPAAPPTPSGAPLPLSEDDFC